MLEYNQSPVSVLELEGKQVFQFEQGNQNIDLETVKSFGEEWHKFSSFSEHEIANAGNQYFDILLDKINKESIVLDVGCGSGRWSKYLAPLVKHIEAIDPSDAVIVANELLKEEDNIRVTQGSVENIPFPDESFDVVFSLGVLHHIPDTQKAIADCVRKVKKNGHFLVYLYYSLDNRSFFYKLLFFVSDILRKFICKMSKRQKQLVCDGIAYSIYLPLVYCSRLLKRILPFSSIYKKIPLSYYTDKSFKIIKNDALDRFGTPLEQRFSKKEIEKMMVNAGLTDIEFSANEPYWHAVGKKK